MMYEGLAKLNHDYLLRERFIIQQRNQHAIVINNKRLINFASNDYLNLANHPAVKTAFIEGVERFGVGAGSAALIAGHYQIHAELEQALATFFHCDKAIVFTSGYLANLGVITTFAKRHHTIVADKFCHASLIDAMLLSGIKHTRYPHQNYQQAEHILKQHPQSILITDGVFSMQGDIADAKKLAAMAKQYSALFIMDDAHGVGVLGKTGRGVSELFQLSQADFACLIVPFGKAFGGLGAAVVGQRDHIEYILQLARTYRYTTALPPAMAAAMLAVLHILDTESWRRERLQAVIQFFLHTAQLFNLKLTSDDLTPIKSIVIGHNQQTLQLQTTLLQHGFYVACIRPPTVPKGGARLRISLSCLHEEQDILRLLTIIKNNLP